jgi:hypothetical protein
MPANAIARNENGLITRILSNFRGLSQYGLRHLLQHLSQSMPESVATLQFDEFRMVWRLVSGKLFSAFLMVTVIKGLENQLR